MEPTHEGPCVDVDTFIPTGVCALCSEDQQEPEPTE